MSKLAKPQRDSFVLALATGCFIVAGITSPAVAQDPQDPRQDGAATVIPLPFFAYRVQFDQSGKLALVVRNEPNRTQLACYDTDSQQPTGRHDYAGAISGIVAAGPYFILIESLQRRMTVLDNSLKTVGSRQFSEPIGDAPVPLDGILQVGTQRYSLPTLEPLKDAGQASRPPPTAVPSPAGWIIDGFVMDEARKKPLWFAGHPAIPGKQAKFLCSSTVPRIGGFRLAPMVIRGQLAAAVDRPWDLQLTASFTPPFEKLRSPDGKPPQGWIRLQAVPSGAKADAPTENDVVFGRIRLPLPADLELQNFRRAFMTATRERCLALVGQNLIVFRFLPERVAAWGSTPRISIDEAPLLIPSDSVTAWDLKATANRIIDRVEIPQGQGCVSWDANSKRVLIDPRPALAALDDETLQAAIFEQRQIPPTATLEESLQRVNDPNSPVIQMLAAASGRAPQGLLWSLPVELTATCADGSVLQFSGNCVIDIDKNRLRTSFDARQAQRIASMQPPPLNPARRLNIIYPSAASASTEPDVPPVPLIPNLNDLMIESLIGVGVFTLVAGLFLPLSCLLFNVLFGRSDPIELPSALKSLAILLAVGLIATGFDSMMIGASTSLFASSKRIPLPAMVWMTVFSMCARTSLMFGGITALARIPAGRSLAVTVMLTVLSTMTLLILGGVITVGLVVLQQMGVI